MHPTFQHHTLRFRSRKRAESIDLDLQMLPHTRFFFQLLLEEKLEPDKNVAEIYAVGRERVKYE